MARKMNQELTASADLATQLAAEQRKSAELTRLAGHLQRLRERERGLLARELHDELGGLFTAAKLDATRIKMRLGVPDPDVSERLTHLIGLLNLGVQFKRRIIEELTPSSLRHLGLGAALEFLIDDHLKHADIAMERDLQTVALSDTLQLTAYRLVQEALSNIQRHAKATWMRVELKQIGERVHLLVEDDGGGFDPSHTDPDGFGLTMMNYRISGEGGSMTVDSALGQGTRVRADLPALPETAGSPEGAPPVGV